MSEKSPPYATGSVRNRLQRALAGEPVEHPVYVAYDWFVENRPIDWEWLFAQGMGQISHADLVRVDRPHLTVEQNEEVIDGESRRVVRWITDRGELRESFAGEWRREFFVKKPDDYRILARAFEDTTYTATSEFFDQSERALGDRGITLGSLGWAPIRRTPLLEVQIDFAGPEQFSLDLADEVAPLMELLDQLGELTLAKVREAVKTPARYIKLWENLSIEMFGPRVYRRWFVPMYRRILDVLGPADKRLVVHYDGRLRVIAEDVAALDIDGIDSFTEPPEGDMQTAEARRLWPDKFLWLHPPLGWFHMDREELVRRVERIAREAGPRRFCFELSEDIPFAWKETIPAVLETLAAMG